MLISSAVMKLMLATGTVMAATEAPSATGGDQNSLYFALSGVVIAAISSGTVIFNSRNKPAPEPQSVRYVDAPTSWQLVNELAELYAEQVERAARSDLKSEMWEARAMQMGWQGE